MEYRRALAIAGHTLLTLRAGCELICLAGSVRRRKEEVKDIELVAIPKVRDVKQPGAIFPQPERPLLRMLDRLCANPASSFERGDKWGERWRKLIYRHGADEIAIDLFLVERAAWGPQLAIRTGPAEFSKRLVSPEPWGVLPAGYSMQHGIVHDPQGQPLPFETEEAYFTWLRLPCWEPWKRSELLLANYIDRYAIGERPALNSGEPAAAR